jgi:hypothetical protein
MINLLHLAIISSNQQYTKTAFGKLKMLSLGGSKHKKNRLKQDWI